MCMKQSYPMVQGWVFNFYFILFLRVEGSDGICAGDVLDDERGAQLTTLHLALQSG